MPAARDPFEAFAERSGLRLRAQSIYSAPRDVLDPPSDSEQHFLVRLEKEGQQEEAIALVFLLPMADARSPGLRDVLWWLAADAWALQQANGRITDWATGYGYPAADKATERLFEIQARQVAALRDLVGPDAFRRLLEVYSSEVSRST